MNIKKCYICDNKLDTLLDSLNLKLYYCNVCFLINNFTKKTRNLYFAHQSSTDTLVLTTDTSVLATKLHLLPLSTNNKSKYNTIILDRVLEYVNNPCELINLCKNMITENGKILFNIDSTYLNKHKFVYKHFIKTDKYSFFTTNTLKYISSKYNFELSVYNTDYWCFYPVGYDSCNDYSNITNILLDEIEQGIYDEKLYKIYYIQYGIYKAILNEHLKYMIDNHWKIMYLSDDDKYYIDFLCDGVDLKKYTERTKGSDPERTKGSDPERVFVFTFDSNIKSPEKIERASDIFIICN